jgi:penicillin G amidase
MKRGALWVGCGVLVAALVAVLAYTFILSAGMSAAAKVNGTIAGLALQAPVQILRDARGVPHIRARNEHDLFFADGYVEASDRLFQLDLLRRFVYGDLSEIFGPPTLSADEDARVVPVRQIVERQYNELSPRERAILQAFSDGVNAAMAREPLPVEFRLLLYQPAPWRPEDTLAVGFVTVLDLIDSWNDVASRVGRRVPLTDPCYDAPVTQGLRSIADPARCTTQMRTAALLQALRNARPPIGSNEWAVGAAHSETGRALLANDPHLRLGIPGVWYLIDLQAPGYHAAGASLAGTPGVILGHNDRIAWGATNGAVTSLSVFDAPPNLNGGDWQTETIHVRFAGSRTARYYRTKRLFGTEITLPDGKKKFVLVRWNAYADPTSPLVAFDELDRAASIADALRALRSYPGPTQNFVLADTSGRAAYHLAGEIPDDPLWARGIHPASDLSHAYPSLPFDVLPNVAPARDAIVWTANNKMYGPSYRYRLTAAFEPPYRAHRIAELLRAAPRYGVQYFAAMQMDTLSLPEREIAQSVPALRGWDGRFTPSSRQATIAFHLRVKLASRAHGIVAAVLQQRAHPDTPTLTAADFNAQPWGTAGAVTVKHPFASLGINLLNGTTFAGNGDAYTVHVQNQGFSQSFRAVWDIGNWDAGGISIPQGESGEPGSKHYTDEAQAWAAGELLPLPYSDAAVRRATVDRLTLMP